MFDFNVEELKTLFDMGFFKIIEQEGLVIVFFNDQLYIPKSSIYVILNHLNKYYIDEWINKAF